VVIIVNIVYRVDIVHRI